MTPRLSRRLFPANGGFTFIEIFVVLAIIGVLAGAVVLHSIGADRDRHLATEAERLAALIELARGEALGRNESWGLFVKRTRYGFKVYNELDGTWEAALKHTFRTREAPQDVEFSLEVHGLAAVSTDALSGQPEGPNADDDGDSNADLPEVLILASGEQTPFVIGVSTPGSPSWRVQSDGISRTRASPAAESDELT